MLELNERYSDVTFRIMVIKSAKGDFPDRARYFREIPLILISSPIRLECVAFIGSVTPCVVSSKKGSTFTKLLCRICKPSVLVETLCLVSMFLFTTACTIFLMFSLGFFKLLRLTLYMLGLLIRLRFMAGIGGVVCWVGVEALLRPVLIY